jgi:hypothetical protein
LSEKQNEMKKITQILLMTVVVIAFGCSSCKEPIEPSNNTFTITDEVIDGITYKKLEGIINENISLTSSDNWLLSGGVFVEEGHTLTILNGGTIYTDTDVTTFLSVMQGAKVFIEGSQDNPVVFTPLTDNPTYGDWGGIIVNGYASLNTGFTAEGEGGTGIYGGDDDNDDSGILRYVRVEYAGKILGTDNELNGFSFNGVGDGTTVEYIQAYKGSDDGIEFFGGTVNVRYAVSTHNQDDSFDWTHGWRGKGQYWLAQQGPDGGDRGIEADNNSDDNLLEPYSNPILCNITLVGYNDGDSLNTGIRFREGTKGKVYNAFITGFPKYGVRVSDEATLNNLTNGQLILSNSLVEDNGTNFKDCDIFETLTLINEDPWFDIDQTIGSDTYWTEGWIK